MNKKKQVAVYLGIAAAELIILLVLILRCALAERADIFFGEDFGNTIPMEDCVTELERGSYMAYLTYQTSSDDVSCQTAADTSYGTVFGDSIPLLKEMTEKSFEVRIREDTDSFYIQINTPEEAEAVVSKLELKENSRQDRAFCFTIFVIFLLLDMVLYLRKKRVWESLSAEQRNAYMVLALVVVLALVPYYTNYITGGHDIRFHMYRIDGLAEGLREGQFPVRMQPIWLNDFGYPVSIMYGDLFLYIPAYLRLIGYSLRAAYKIYLFLIILTTVGVSFYCAKNTTASYKYGVLGSLLYTLSFYQIINIYVRVAVGEYTSLAFMPLVFFALSRIFHAEGREKRKYVVQLMIAYTAILQTHVLSFEVVILFSLFYCLIQWRALLKNLWCLIKTAIVTILLNLSFLLPFLDYMISHDMAVENADWPTRMQIGGMFPAQYFQTIFFGAYLSGAADEGIKADMPLGIGLALLFAFFLFLWQYACYKGRLREALTDEVWREQKRLAVLMLLGMLMTCWFFPWTWIAKLPVIGSYLTAFQYAWRYLGIVTVMGFFLAVHVVRNAEITHGRTGKIVIMSLFCLCTVFNAFTLYDRIFANYSPEKYISTDHKNSLEAIVEGEYLLEGVNYRDCINSELIIDEGIEIAGYEKEGLSASITCQNNQFAERNLIVPYLAYKGFVAVDTDTKEKLTTFINNGRLGIVIPEEYDGVIQVCFQEPMLWRLAEAVSLITLIALIFIGIKGSGRLTAWKNGKSPHGGAR